MAWAEHGTLVADTETDTTLSGQGDVLVVNHGSDPIYATLGATAPTVAGDDTHVVPAGGYRVLEGNERGDQRVRLISSGTPAYSIERVGQGY